MPLAPRLLLLFAAAALLLPAQAATPPVPQPAAGAALDLQDTPALARWGQTHSAHTGALLRGLGGRAPLREKIERYESAAAARVVGVTRLPAEAYLYWRRAAAEEAHKLVRRNGLQGRETVVFDPAPARPRSSSMLPAPSAAAEAAASADGGLVALLLPATGAPAPALLRVLDVRSGRPVGREVQRAVPGSVSWLPDGSGFFFQRLQHAGPGVTAAVAAAPQRELVFMKVGAGEAGMRTVLRAGDAPGITAAETATLEVQPDGRVLLVVRSESQPGLKLWHSTAAAVLDGKADWKPLADTADQVSAVALKDERFYALTKAGAPRQKLVGGRLDSHTVATAAVLQPEGEAVLTGLAAASDALYVAAQEGNLMQLLRLAHRDGATPVELPVPALGQFTLGAGNARADLPGLLLHLHSWTRAPQVFLLAPDGRATATGLQDNGPYDAPGDVLATEVWVERADGTRLPLALVHKADVALDGNNPVLLAEHGGVHPGNEPAYSASRLAWLEAGGVYAFVRPPGADPGVAAQPLPAAPGEGVQDLITSAQWLVANRWTRPSRLALAGRGSGGWRVLQALNQRADLFAAVVVESVAMDPAHGPATPGLTRPQPAPQPASKHPAVLLAHDGGPLAPVAHTIQAAARLLAATAGDPPVLLHLPQTQGPAAAIARSRALDARADRYAFLLWQLGVPGYTAAR